MDADLLAKLPLWLAAFLLSLTCHEAAHALAGRMLYALVIPVVGFLADIYADRQGLVAFHLGFGTGWVWGGLDLGAVIRSQLRAQAAQLLRRRQVCHSPQAASDGKQSQWASTVAPPSTSMIADGAMNVTGIPGRGRLSTPPVTRATSRTG